jgi:hypothetical protein
MLLTRITDLHYDNIRVAVTVIIMTVISGCNNKPYRHRKIETVVSWHGMV